jgi:hypothetical protein
MYAFYIEYKDGTVTIQDGLTKIGAKRKYNAFIRSAEYDDKMVLCWGWEQMQQPLTLSQQIRAKKAETV